MTSTFVDQDIRRDEGFEPNAYPDPISKGDPWTVGFGSTGAGIGEGTVWSLAQAVKAQVAHRQQCEAQLDHLIPWWRQLSDFRGDVLVNMAYQLGAAGVSRFTGALVAMERGDFETAATEMLDSQWARQTPKRAQRLAEQMRTGERIGSAIPPAPVDPIATTKQAVA